LALAVWGVSGAAPTVWPATEADRRLAAYFQQQTAQIARRCLSGVNTRQDWVDRSSEWRWQAAEMLGLWPEPERGELKPVITGRILRDDIRVEKLHFQSLPGLYVTANLYLPAQMSGRVPAILYLCGHGPVISNRVSYGNKVSYQHHGIWFARHGYACLVIDTVQWGEILGSHHGTYREGAWWWNSRGYTPAGVEAWNGIRALDYLCSRPEVDTNWIGVTGRSGGGSYSWTVAALDQRIKAAAPVAGITDLQNYVVDGAIEGHCDCMFFFNFYQWDYPQLAALVAPRPLLLVNTDSDTIFPLDGVMRTHAHLKRIYQLLGASTNLGLVIGPGPHKDTQDLQVPVFRWFNRYLKKEEPLIALPAEKLFAPHELKVFSEIPSDAINTNIQSLFCAKAPPPLPPASAEDWPRQRAGWLAGLQKKVFYGWPENPGDLHVTLLTSEKQGGLQYDIYEFESQPHVVLRLYTVRRAGLTKPTAVYFRAAGVTNLLTSEQATNVAAPSQRLIAEARAALGLPVSPAMSDISRFRENAIWIAMLPRGLGADAWSGDERKLTHLRRRFMLLGQTLDAMRVWDLRRGLQAVLQLKGMKGLPVHCEAEGAMGVNMLYASIFEPEVVSLELWRLPPSHDIAPDYPNVLRVLDIPQAVALAADGRFVRLHQDDPEKWEYPVAVARLVGRSKFEIKSP